jgi:hypothetical protein
MDLMAVMILIILGLFSVTCAVEQEYKMFGIMWGIILFFQLLWFPVVLSEYEITTHTFITTQYRGLQFSEPVKVIENRKYKKMSVFFDETTVEIKVVHSNK